MTAATIRTAALKQTLLDRRREMQNAIETRVRESRAPRRPDVGDALDNSDADVGIGMDFMLLQMRATTLTRIDEALLRLDAGQYGVCFECGKAIAIRRLRALPFAVRCHECEDRREAEAGRAGPMADPCGRTAFFADNLGS